jgi:hypothetical protein
MEHWVEHWMEDLQCGVILILVRYFGDFHSILTCISIKSR